VQRIAAAALFAYGDPRVGWPAYVNKSPLVSIH